MKKLTIMFALVAMIMGFFGCKKGINSDVKANLIETEKFFKTKGELKPEVKRVYDYLKSKNTEKEFVSKFVEKEGLPLWDRAMISHNYASKEVNNAEVYVTVPIVLNDYLLNALISVKITDDAIIPILFRAKDYKAFGYSDLANTINAKEIAILMMSLESDIFGHKNFLLIDPLLKYSNIPLNPNEQAAITFDGLAREGGEYYDGGFGAQPDDGCTHHASSVILANGDEMQTSPWITDWCPPGVNWASYYNALYNLTGPSSPGGWNGGGSGTSSGGSTTGNPNPANNPPANTGNNTSNPCVENNLPMLIVNPCGNNNESGWASLEEDDTPDSSPTHIKVDLNKMLDCFSQIPDFGSICKVKLYVDIPKNDDPTVMATGVFKTNVGHTYITLTKTGADGTSISQTFGFYPVNGMSNAISLGTAPSPSYIVNDGNSTYEHEYNAAITMRNLSASQFTTLINKSKSCALKNYNITTYNCTSFALEILNSIRPPSDKIVSLPRVFTLSATLPPTSLFFIESPVGLYQTFQNFNSTQATQNELEISTIGNSETSKGECN